MFQGSQWKINLEKKGVQKIRQQTSVISVIKMNGLGKSSEVNFHTVERKVTLAHHQWLQCFGNKFCS